MVQLGCPYLGKKQELSPASCFTLFTLVCHFLRFWISRIILYVKCSQWVKWVLKTDQATRCYL